MKTTAAAEMAKGFKGMAVRGADAEERFVAYAQAHAGVSREEALRVVTAYRKARVIKFDRVTGQFDVKHGAFLDAEVIRNAAKEVA